MRDVSNLVLKSLGGLVWMQVILAGLLFLPAGSMRFWQGWVYWGLFFLCCLWITVYFLKHDPWLVERRLRAGPGAESRKSQKILQVAATVSTCAVLVVAGLDHRLGWSHVPVPLVLAGDGLVAVGFLIMFLVFRENTYAASTIRVEAGQRVISTGPYRIVGHPMYAGALLMFAGTALALASLSAFVPAAAAGVVVVVRLLDEERYLSEALPGYDEYRRRVRYRLIPLVW